MSTKEKQQFLRVEILEQNYDIEVFQSFLEKAKPNDALDIEAWSFEELKRLVYQFKAQYGKEKTAIPTPPAPSPTKVQSNSSQSKPTIQPPAPELRTKAVSTPAADTDSSHQKSQLKSPTLASNSKSYNESQAEIPKPPAPKGPDDDQDFIDNVTNQQTYIKHIQCGKIQPSPIFETNCTVVMKRFEKTEGGLFEQDYVSYCVETPQHNWSVMRRYNDFVWLRDGLEKLHPGLPVPPVPKKGAFRNFDESHLLRRMTALEGFMNKILSIPDLKAEPLVYGFLKSSDALEWMKVKKEYTFEEKIKIDKIKKLKGKIRLAIDPKISKVVNFTRQNLLLSQQRIGKIYKDSKQIVINMESNAKLFEGISNTFTELSQQSAKFNKQIGVQLDKTNTELFKMMSALIRDVSKVTMDQAQSYKQYLYNTYKYELHNLIVLNQSIKKVDEVKEQYSQLKTKLKRTKEKLYDDKNIAKWGVSTVQYEKLSKDKNAYDKNECLAMMLPKQTDTLQQLRQQYALLNGQFYEELMRYTTENPLYLSRNLLELSKKQSSTAGANLMIWADIMTFFTNFNSGAKLIKIPTPDNQEVKEK